MSRCAGCGGEMDDGQHYRCTPRSGAYAPQSPATLDGIPHGDVHRHDCDCATCVAVGRPRTERERLGIRDVHAESVSSLLVKVAQLDAERREYVAAFHQQSKTVSLLDAQVKRLAAERDELLAWKDVEMRRRTALSDILPSGMTFLGEDTVALTIEQHRRIARILDTFRRAPMSASSLQEVLNLAEELNGAME